jgi:hypothetical protein
MCGSINTVSKVFCDECNARLVPMTSAPDEEEEEQPKPVQGFSLPTIPLDEEEEVAAAAQEDSAAEDWMGDLRGSASEETDTDTADISGRESSRSGQDDLEPLEPVDIPDWLHDQGPTDEGPQPSPGATAASPPEASEDRSTSEEGPPEQPPLEAADIPEWLRELAPLEIETEVERITAVEDDAFAEPPEFPDWLRDLGPVEGDASVPPSDELPTAEESEEPASRAEADGQGKSDLEVPARLQEATDPPAQAEAPGEPTGAGPDEPISAAIEIPDWLRESLGAEAEQAPRERAPEEELSTPRQARPVGAEAEEEVPPESALESVEIPSWLQEAERSMEETLPEEAVGPSGDEPAEKLETPAWLTELLAEVPGAPGEASPFPTETVFGEDELGAGLERARIPEWLQDLRPSDAEDQEVARGMLETEGLLRGLRGLLPASPATEAPSTHEGLSAVVTSQASLARAELLQSLLSEPLARREAPPRERRATTAVSVERWLVAGVLLLAVLGMLLAPLMMRRVPSLTQPVATSGALQLYEVVDELGAADEVLVAFDYGPPAADELNVVARPILEHVIDRGADVSIVSTRPDGPLVASALMSEIADSPDQYTLLSYRPGAATAVSQLLTVGDRSPTLLLVLTSQAAPLRRWVEQARAHSGDQLPVTLGGSAALEPAASPYLDVGAGQLRGSIHGLRGAASYEALRGVRGDATQRLNALAAGHVAVVALMIVGAIFYGLKKARGEST